MKLKNATGVSKPRKKVQILEPSPTCNTKFQSPEVISEKSEKSLSISSEPNSQRSAEQSPDGIPNTNLQTKLDVIVEQFTSPGVLDSGLVGSVSNSSLAASNRLGSPNDEATEQAKKPELVYKEGVTKEKIEEQERVINQRYAPIEMFERPRNS
jgi:hypothetical protein